MVISLAKAVTVTLVVIAQDAENDVVCPNCNRINSGKMCHVHNVMTCLGCLYDYPNSVCDDPTIVKQSERFNAEKKAEMDKLLNMVKEGGDTWVPQ